MYKNSEQQMVMKILQFYDVFYCTFAMYSKHIIRFI